MRDVCLAVGSVMAGISIVVANASSANEQSRRIGLDVAAGQIRASAPSVFENDGILGSTELVLVRPMLESDVSVSLRARQAGVPEESLQAKSYGLKIDVLFKDAEIGQAFMRRAQVYHLGSRKDQIVVDETYYYCDGFLSADIVKVTEKSWSSYYSVDVAAIARLDTLSEAVRNGMSHRDAFEAVEPISGNLLGTTREERQRSERAFTWFSGKQVIDKIGIELIRSPGVGNRVAVRFVP